MQRFAGTFDEPTCMPALGCKGVSAVTPVNTPVKRKTASATPKLVCFLLSQGASYGSSTDPEPSFSGGNVTRHKVVGPTGGVLSENGW